MMESHCDVMDFLSANGIPTVFQKKCTTVDEIILAIDEIAEMRDKLEYDIDGAVVKIDQIQYRGRLPAGSKYSSNILLRKYPPEERIIVMDEILQM